MRYFDIIVSRNSITDRGGAKREPDRKIDNETQNRPKDFEYAELRRVMEHFGYTEQDGDGSRKRFVDVDGNTLTLHRPHKPPQLMPYQIAEVIEHLERRKLI